MKIQILIDNPESWFLNFYDELLTRFKQAELPDPILRHSANDVDEGDILFILSCDFILQKKDLEKNQSNIVIHASDLPKGRGWAPWTWQVIEGCNKIPLSLIEADLEVDSGPIYFKDNITLEGHELIQEIRALIARKVIEMSIKYSRLWPNISATDQIGKPSYYKRRKKLHQKIKLDQKLSEIFNNLRVADNERYPIYFEHLGHEYVIKINKR